MRIHTLIIALAFVLSIIVACDTNDKTVSSDVTNHTAGTTEKGKANTQDSEDIRGASETADVNDVCTDDQIPEMVSMIQLISTPEKYHGKCVLLVGFVNLEFEGDAIYLHEEDYKIALFKNAIWLNIDRDNLEKYVEAFNKQYCIVEGTFNAYHKGHMGLFSGEIEYIKRMQLMIKRAQEEQNEK